MSALNWQPAVLNQRYRGTTTAAVDDQQQQPSNTHAIKQGRRSSQEIGSRARGSALPPHSSHRGRQGLAMVAGRVPLTFLMGEAEHWPNKSSSLSLSRLAPPVLFSSRAFFVDASPEPAPPLPRCKPASAIPALLVYPPPPPVRTPVCSGWRWRSVVGLLALLRRRADPQEKKKQTATKTVFYVKSCKGVIGTGKICKILQKQKFETKLGARVDECESEKVNERSTHDRDIYIHR